jgi:hypothetical protein
MRSDWVQRTLAARSRKETPSEDSSCAPTCTDTETDTDMPTGNPAALQQDVETTRAYIIWVPSEGSEWQ